MRRSRDELARNTLAGAVTTSVCVAILNPVDVLRIRWQTRPATATATAPATDDSLARFAARAAREEGLTRVWSRGLGVNMASVALSSGFRQGVYPTARDAVIAARGGSDKRAADMALAGFASGAVGFLLATPFFAA